MSLTNPKTVVTEERLAEFYQGILPYLGGMPEILANKFSKANMYSTTEKMVGQWTDGKPLYQKTIEITDFSAITSGTRNWYVLYNSQDTIYDQVFIKQDATFMSWDVDGQKWRAEPNEYLLDSLTPPSYSVIRPWVDNTGALHISILNSGTSTPYKGSYNNKKLYVTIQYTKTTDSAVSIGVDTDYSTTEKIIGTWINGKPIYQKTFSIKAPTVTTAGTMAEKSTPHGIDNIGTRIMCIQHGSASTQIFGNSNSISYLTVYADATSLNVRTNNTIWSNADIVVTLQYTKTTD